MKNEKLRLSKKQLFLIVQISKRFIPWWCGVPPVSKKRRNLTFFTVAVGEAVKLSKVRNICETGKY